MVLPTTVLEKKSGKFVTDLPAESFSVFENKILQELAIVQYEDIPVSMGLVLDNSDSMRYKREAVNAAAFTFVEASNIEDEIFVVNFSDKFNLDAKLTSDIGKLKEALERITAAGNTAVYDAIIGSLDYLSPPENRPQNARHDKKVLLLVTDGIDRGSRWSLPRTITELQKKDVSLYAIGIFDNEDRSDESGAKEALQGLAEATGGLALFSENNAVEIGEACEHIARAIRSRYTLGYDSSANAAAQTFRRVEVKLQNSPEWKLRDNRNPRDFIVRTRTGYYPKPAPVKK